MVTILPSNKILVTKSNDNIDKINRSLEVCPSCKRDSTVITDPKTGEIICDKCGMVLLDKLSAIRSDGCPIVTDETEGKTTTGLLPGDS
jgi:ribosomal protein L37AE/L43A